MSIFHCRETDILRVKVPPQLRAKGGWLYVSCLTGARLPSVLFTQYIY